MLVCFKLSMPNKGSWNGKWSGEENLYAIIRQVPKKHKTMPMIEELLKNNHYSYSFGDGWVARIEITQVEAKEANKIRQKSQGFCGYEWMIDSLIKNGKIQIDR